MVGLWMTAAGANDDSDGDDDDAMASITGQQSH